MFRLRSALGFISLGLSAAGGCGSTLPTGQPAAYAYANPVDGGKIYAVPRGGGTPTLLVAGPAPGSIGGSFVFDGTTAYYTDEILLPGSGTALTGLHSIPLSGGTPTTLVSGLVIVGALAVDATNIYFVAYDDWTPGTPSAIEKAPLTGGTPETLVGNLAALPQGLAVAGDSIYWTDTAGSINRTAIAGGGAVETLATNQGQVLAIAANTSGVFWTNNGQVSVDCGASGGSIAGLLAGGGSVTTLATGLDNVGSLALFNADVYYTFSGPVMCNTFNGMNGQLVQVGPTTDVSVALASGLEWPLNLFVDEEGLYYTTITDPENYVLAPHAILWGPAI